MNVALYRAQRRKRQYRQAVEEIDLRFHLAAVHFFEPFFRLLGTMVTELVDEPELGRRLRHAARWAGIRRRTIERRILKFDQNSRP